MATKTLRFCAHMGCNVLISTGTYCTAHLSDMASRYGRRGTSAERGYDAQWRKARDAYLREHPLCERCEQQELTEPATMVHHKVALRDGGARLDPVNFMALCESCHAIVEGRKFEAKLPDEK